MSFNGYCMQHVELAMAEQPTPSPIDKLPGYTPQGASALVQPRASIPAAATACPSVVMLPETLEVTVSDGADGLVHVRVTGFDLCTAASSSYADVRSALVSLVGPDFMQGRELSPQCADPSDVLIRYTHAGQFQPTGRLKRRKLRVIRLERCFYCGRALPAKEKRCVTRLGFTPRRVTCCSVRSECPRSFTVGDARYTKDTHDSRLIITLASNVVIDAVPVVFTSP